MCTSLWFKCFYLCKGKHKNQTQATIHRRFQCNVMRYSSILYHFWIISLTLPIPAESAHTGMINSSVSFMCLAGYRCRVGVDDCVWYQAPFVWETFFCISKTFEFNTSDVFQNIFINPDEVLLFLCMLIQLHLILFALMFTVLFTVMWKPEYTQCFGSFQNHL